LVELVLNAPLHTLLALNTDLAPDAQNEESLVKTEKERGGDAWNMMKMAKTIQCSQLLVL
jgi:hypothetical protein